MKAKRVDKMIMPMSAWQKQVKNRENEDSRFFKFWFVFYATTFTLILGGIVFVLYKVLVHFGIL